MSLEQQPVSLEQQIRQMKFDSVDAVIGYLHSLGVNTRDTNFTHDADGNLVLREQPVTAIDKATGKIKFTDHGINATAGFIEDNI